MILKKMLTALVSLSVITFTWSCSNTNFRTSSVKPAETNDLLYFEPVSLIAHLMKGSKAAISNSLSSESRTLVAEATNGISQIPISEKLTLEDPSLRFRVERETAQLSITGLRERKIADIKVPPTLDSLIESRGKRFGLITFATGFMKTKESHLGEMTNGAAPAVVTLRLFSKSTDKSASTIYAVILDAKENNVAFYNFSPFTQHDPLNRKVIETQMHRLFEGYYLPKQRNTGDPLY